MPISDSIVGMCLGQTRLPPKAASEIKTKYFYMIHTFNTYGSFICMVFMIKLFLLQLISSYELNDINRK